MTPIFSSRGQHNNSNNNSNSNSSQKPSDSKRIFANHNIKTIYSYNIKDKTLYSNNSNNISTTTTEEKNLFEDLLSEDVKITETSSNKITSNYKDKKMNDPKGKNIITPRFNNNTVFESAKNDNNIQKEEKEENEEKNEIFEDKKEINENLENNQNIIKNENKEEIILDNKKQDNLLDNISEVSTDFKNLQNMNSN